MIDPSDLNLQKRAFRAAAISNICLLTLKFKDLKMQMSREMDPIVQVTFTGLFDFFIKCYGEEWLEWWMAGRGSDWKDGRGAELLKAEQEYLTMWSRVVEDTIKEYSELLGLKQPNRCRGLQPSGCLDRNTVRVMDQGIIYPDELMKPGEGLVKNLDLSVRDGIRVQEGIANQPSRLIKLTLANKRTIRLTPDHRLSIDGKWIRADALKVDDLLDYSIGQYTNTSNRELINLDDVMYTREYRKEVNGHGLGLLSKTISTPSHMNEELSYFIGALFGNGCLSSKPKRVRFSHGRLDVLHKLSRISKSLFDLEGSINPASNSKGFELSIGSNQLYDWILLNNLDKGNKSKDIDRIPYVIRTSSKECILSFIAGLIDTDGSSRGNRFSIDLSSEMFIRNLQQVGEAVGLCLGISHNTKGSNFQQAKSIWTCSLLQTESLSTSLNYLNQTSIKLGERPCHISTNKQASYKPYRIKHIEYETEVDYSYDITVEGIDDNDAWYWQGAIKSHNSKALLTGGASGWSPSKAQYYIRRITFRRDNPVALACLDYGYNIVPGQGDKDDEGKLLTDYLDPRVTEWLVEIPTKAPWVDSVEGTWDIENAPVTSQWSLYMQCQMYYSDFNVSATIEFNEDEIDTLSQLTYDAIRNNDGYVSTALLPKFNAPFPRLPFEKISKDEYDKQQARVLYDRIDDDFLHLLSMRNNKEDTYGPDGCESDFCAIKK